MNTLFARIPVDALNPNRADGRTLDRRRRTARRAEATFFACHSGAGARALHRIFA